jgi:hypothetical protein
MSKHRTRKTVKRINRDITEIEHRKSETGTDTKVKQET